MAAPFINSIIATSGVFSGVHLQAKGNSSTRNFNSLVIPLQSIKYGSGSLADGTVSGHISGDYRAFMRAMHDSYYAFMTGVATGVNKPSYFLEAKGSPSIYNDTTLSRIFSTTIYYDIADDISIKPE